MSSKPSSPRRGRPPSIAAKDILAMAGQRLGTPWTMASIAGELGVSEAAIYYYFASKAAVLEALGARVVAAFRLPLYDGDWRAWLLGVAESYYQLLLQHPFLLDNRSWLELGAPASHWAETVMATLKRAGFKTADGFYVFSAVAAVSVEFARVAVARNDARPAAQDFSATPTLAELVRDLGARPPDQHLRCALLVILDGAASLRRR
jgi:AcrR family transcriptional regulator